MTEAEFSEIYRQHAAKVISGIYRIVRNESVAEELMQESFIQFLAAAQKTEITSIKGLLFQISHNLAVDFVRKDTRAATGGDIERLQSKMYDQNEMEMQALRGEIVARLAKEDENYLKFYILRTDFGMNSDDIADTLKISRRSVYRLREQVKTVLADFL
jgi:RNA polymerase sigma-70 factor, ECF subfamily